MFKNLMEFPHHIIVLCAVTMHYVHYAHSYIVANVDTKNTPEMRMLLIIQSGWYALSQNVNIRKIKFPSPTPLPTPGNGGTMHPSVSLCNLYILNVHDIVTYMLVMGNIPSIHVHVMCCYCNSSHLFSPITVAL